MSFRTPKYRLHKGSGQALVQINGRRVYLGKFDSRGSKEKYKRLVAEYLSAGQTPKPSVVGTNGQSHSLRINDLILPFWQHVKQRYLKNGKPTSEIQSFKTALRPVRRLYGSEQVTKFGPLALVACRSKLIEAGYCRKRINQHVGRIRRMFKWGVGRELVPESVWRALSAVDGLRLGEGIERPPIKPVSEERVAAIQKFVTPQVWTMINVQLWTACRPGEVCIMRAIDILMQGKIWEYRPHSHKVEHHGKERVIYLGPHIQEILKPWLKTDLHAYIFSPKEARDWSEVRRSANRTTPRPKKERPTKRKPRPKRVPGECYDVHAYDHAIRRGCELAFGMPKQLRNIPSAAKVASGKAKIDETERKRLLGLASAWRQQHCWHANQLRHTAATRLRAAYGIELARIILGHSSAVTSEIYAEIDRDKAKEAMGKMG